MEELEREYIEKLLMKILEEIREKEKELKKLKDLVEHSKPSDYFSEFAKVFTEAYINYKQYEIDILKREYKLEENKMKLSEYKNYIINKYGKKAWEDYKSTYAYSIYLLTEEEQKRKLQKDGNNIRFIYNPSEEMQLIAVKENSNAIQYIDSPSEELQLLAVKDDPTIIIDIKNPTEKVIQEAIKGIDFYFYGMHLLRYLENDLKEE